MPPPEFLDTPLAIFYLTLHVITSLSVGAVLVAVFLNFTNADKVKGVRKGKNSIVATGTMLLFFFLMYLCIRFGWGRTTPEWESVRMGVALVGMVIVVFGAAFNIWGRLHLGGNWANQIRIYKTHQLITSGPYRFVRHPLYASLVWMFYGAALVYANFLVCVATTLIFLPFMVYRARQEETLLAAVFPEYGKYRQTTGMLFPKLFPLS